REAADAMINSGMVNYGYQYVNIDDCWMVKANSDDSVIGGRMRDERGEILTNKKFPDMKAMTHYIHSKGLKAGTYISPGPLTCGQYAGSYQHEKQDAQTFAGWGFDFLKYDWCSYGRIAKDRSIHELQKPYKLMWKELQKLDRDVVFNLCQYGMGEVWQWGDKVGNSWRTTGDLGLEHSDEMPGFYRIGISNAQHWEFARPGAWNDPDYILIGWVGSAFITGEGRLTTLTPDEQYFYMSMWSLMASPLIFSGDMAKLDPFTLNILCNSEVIEVNQDALGKQAAIQRNANNELVMVKELEDGSKAVGLFNLDDQSKKITVNWTDLNIENKQSVRDLWRQKDLGVFENGFEQMVPPHGVALIKVGLKRKI
ncbi:MAG: glycoside hydrolase family 27 protein, partial [Bacteroidales bacterium]|nr:glycoside hydrolase family 27 protein [Bacteroidales bacterium]